MLPPDPHERELTTWSEIAAYLGVTVRTAQTWRNERGLPVGKLGGRVIARTRELDQWKAKANEVEPAVAPPSRIGKTAALILVGAAVAAGLAGWMWIGSVNRTPGRIVRYELHGNLLVVFDEYGKRAWTHEFERPIAEPPGPQYARSRFADVDGDGQAELLFLPWHGDDADFIYCFQGDGTIAWRHPLGRTVVDARGQSILSKYWPMDVVVLKKARPDGGRIVILSHHVFSWPAQVAVLTPQGKQVAEYWHPGWLVDMSAGDLNGDGREELILCGVNNSFGDKGEGATLVVLDSGFSTGQGPVLDGDHRRVREIPPGEQLAVLMFPDTPKLAPSSTETRITMVKWVDGYLELRSERSLPGEVVHYQLDPRLRVLNITPSVVLTGAIAPKATSDERLRIVRERFGRVKAIHNSFDRP